jgi:DNA-binding PadR family transcriptional regulator
MGRPLPENITMDVKTVCLGMLTDGEASGYDLKKQFESSFAHFFAAGYGSIYPALSSLAEEDFVSCEHIPQEGKPDRKVYQITTAGRAHLLTALENPAPCHKVRSEFLATMCFAHLMTPGQIEVVLDSRIADTERYLAMFEKIECDCMDDWPPGMHFVLGFGKTMTAAVKAYVEENRHMLAAEQPAQTATK